MRPEEIEARSFAIIEQELSVALSPEQAPVIKRVIHTTADFDYAHTLTFSQDAIKAGCDALRDGAIIITDTNMAKAGITGLAPLGGAVHCFMADEDVAREARTKGITRAHISMDKAASLPEEPKIFAIGNAPTALIRLCELVKSGVVCPELIIGVPVGFVNVVESKELVMGLKLPFIVARGRKGGSTVAAAIVNALIKIAANKEGTKNG